MRISDWSSDVCSSDLILLMRQALPQAKAATETALRALEQGDGQVADVLLAESRWRDLGLEQVQVQSATREMLAPIERGVGGSEERRGGKACVGTCGSRWSP